MNRISSIAASVTAFLALGVGSSAVADDDFETHELEIGNVAVTPFGSPGAGAVHVFGEIRLKPEDYMCFSADPGSCRFTSVFASVVTSQVCNSEADGTGISIARISSPRNGPNLRTLINEGTWTPFTNPKGKLIYYATTFETELSDDRLPACPQARPYPIGPLYFSRVDLYVVYGQDVNQPTQRLTTLDRDGVWIVP
jgi:hypothetical protein